MIVASLIDAGAKFSDVETLLSKLKIDNYAVKAEKVQRAGLSATHFHVEVHHHEHHHRGLSDIEMIIQSADLPVRVKERSLAVFRTLAQAEAEVHNVGVNDVHFHEVGAVDSIIDIVGACICLELLNVDEIQFSKITVGYGQVKCAHGILPVPAPATVKLLKNQTIESGSRVGEQATPTGAAILAALGTQSLTIPEMKLHSVGYGAGTRDDAAAPNVLRAIVGESASLNECETDEISVLRCNLDDITGEHLGYLVEKCFSAGALDVVQIPIYMKKGRPATMIEVIAPLDKESVLREVLLTQGTSFGVRAERQRRIKLKRDIITIIMPEGRVRVKLGFLGSKLIQISPEFEDCRKISERTGENFASVFNKSKEAAQQGKSE
jgi:uncharacterized protein (TIGR00299 family) protein